MRTNEERIAAVHARAAELKRKSGRTRIRIAGGVSAACSLAVLVLLSVRIPAVSGSLPAGSAGPGMSASIFTGSGALGYLVIAVTAFLLGASVTMFCFCLRRRQEKKDGEERP